MAVSSNWSSSKWIPQFEAKKFQVSIDAKSQEPFEDTLSTEMFLFCNLKITILTRWNINLSLACGILLIESNISSNFLQFLSNAELF